MIRVSRCLEPRSYLVIPDSPVTMPLTCTRFLSESVVWNLGFGKQQKRDILKLHSCLLGDLQDAKPSPYLGLGRSFHSERLRAWDSVSPRQGATLVLSLIIAQQAAHRDPNSRVECFTVRPCFADIRGFGFFSLRRLGSFPGRTTLRVVA